MNNKIQNSLSGFKEVGEMTQGSATKFHKETFTKEELENEVWKPLSASSQFESFINYEVSNIGRVRNIQSKKILTSTFVFNSSNIPYLKVDIMNRFHKRKSLYVHRLVAYTFMEDYLSKFGLKTEVNHIDKNTMNNRLSNLELCSATYNHLHSIGKLDKYMKEYKCYWVRCKIADFLQSIIDGKIIDMNSKYTILQFNGITLNFIEKYIEFPNIISLCQILELDKATIRKYNIPKRFELTKEFDNNNKIDLMI